jgi:hypothetical protein
MRKEALAAFVISLIVLAACENSSTSPSDDRSPDLGKKGAFQDAELLIHDLNDHLRSSLRCDIHQPDLTGYAERIPNQDAAGCRFKNRVPMVVLIVRNGKQTYRQYIGRTFAPFYYLRGPTWLVIAPLGTPQEALETLRDELGAVG